MIRIIVTDDHTLVRAGLQRILAGTGDIEIVGEASNGAQALALLGDTPCDVLLLDLSMPGRSGVDLIAQIKASFPHLTILVLTMHGEEQYAVRALKAGAAGYLTKESAPNELVSAVRKVHDGGVYLSPSMAERIARDLSSAATEGPSFRRLSDREFDVFLMLARGLTLGDIAGRLCVSTKTVSTYKARVLQKLQLRSQTDLAHYAIRHDLLRDKL
ncbi:response regulator [Pandoraea sputorum]|uniref:Response regulator uvrY n=1 Tax=Pandoraea sputorum TaxID=93222 RepID=A0A239SIQ8_9BURK|nr:response regulator transcription factor [Pandoraea sputorum]AJC17131.1 DNA-binding response regulator [Pandoraea sputorum]SNU85287.1 Response regulator uvrY [Pandoraea sputorum]VVD84362.1 DNA-binding response regulator [Pandoraea sputorum]VVE75130.1 DNA-binding response regulator [Pandoraea sputorum]